MEGIVVRHRFVQAWLLAGLLLVGCGSATASPSSGNTHLGTGGTPHVSLACQTCGGSGGGGVPSPTATPGPKPATATIACVASWGLTCSPASHVETIDASHPGEISITNYGQLPLDITGFSLKGGGTTGIPDLQVGKLATDCTSITGGPMIVSPGGSCDSEATYQGAPSQGGSLTVTWSTNAGNVAWTFEDSAT
jgi:hypothetical protein